MQGYNGSFLFNTLDAYGITEAGLLNGATPAQIRAAGGGASQFTLTAGIPLAAVRQTDTGLFLQDDWRIRPRLTLTAGLRYEVQTNIGDRRNIAPRIGIAWAPGKGSGTRSAGVFRAGFGMFYERVGADLTLNAQRQDGVRQRQYVVSESGFLPGHSVDSRPSPAHVADQAIRQHGREPARPLHHAGGIHLRTAAAAEHDAQRDLQQRARCAGSAVAEHQCPAAGFERPARQRGNIYQYESADSSGTTRCW